MHKLRTLDLGPYRGREFFATIFVEPDPTDSDGFTVPDDAEKWGISIHFQPDEPYENHVEVARIDTAHGEAHFDKLFKQDQPKEWLGENYTYEDARQELFPKWKHYASQYLDSQY